MNKLIAITAAAAFLAGCASASKDISATYVSPIQYRSYDCDQIALESDRLTAHIAELGGQLDEASSNDAALVGVGAILFWPALFFLGGNQAQEAEYGRLKGEYDALQRSAVEKRCDLPAIA